MRFDLQPFIYHPDPPRLRRTVFSPKHDAPKVVIDSEEKAATNKSLAANRPRLHLSRHTLIPFDPYQYRCNDKRAPDCLTKTHAFSAHILNEFQQSLREPLPSTENAANFYNVDYARVMMNSASPPTMVRPVCLVLAANVRTLRRNDGPLRRHAVGSSLPKRKLFRDRGQRKLVANNTCVIVASAGSLIGSGLGRFIGEHLIYWFN